jgi:5-methylcytosine-specific restriction endonuclease McrA
MVSITYAEYLTTTGWRVRALAAKERAGWRCEHCGSDGPLEVHHWTYARIGHERADDLIVLCDECHDGVHGDVGLLQLALPFDRDCLGAVH